ncbi:hypothetical protein EJ997_12515 [Flaviflexus ciconiae]|uniref:Uncharacterized protein n=1 Tax=Flaviflexus ciconiae TaxID=2496867 RepID=A0A3Q9G8F6_9ACTO|nr:exonuclease domain-containing protein [Flaviflexus ciconiae]AZQ78035.1 hypothetical protein EJ997_12515 [Flaviflexus ciconiae]
MRILRRGELTAARRLDGSRIPFLDTMAIARRILHLPNFKLGQVCAALGIQNSNAHSALTDAYATAEILQAFIREDACTSPDWQKIVSASLDFRGYTIHDPHCTRERLRNRGAAAAAPETLANGAWMNRAIGSRDIPDDVTQARYFTLLDAVLLDHICPRQNRSSCSASPRRAACPRQIFDVSTSTTFTSSSGRPKLTASSPSRSRAPSPQCRSSSGSEPTSRRLLRRAIRGRRMAILRWQSRCSQATE